MGGWIRDPLFSFLSSSKNARNTRSSFRVMFLAVRVAIMMAEMPRCQDAELMP